MIGTPIEATLKKKAAKELQVRDEKGRQRFHGAFTGGFSAGYFNTVGTKEGMCCYNYHFLQIFKAIIIDVYLSLFK